MGDFLNGELPKLFARALYTKHTQRGPAELTWADEVNYWTERPFSSALHVLHLLCVQVGLWTDSLTSNYQTCICCRMIFFFMWTLFIAHQHTKKNDSTACSHHQWILGFVAQGFLKRVLLWREVCGMKVIHRLSKKTCKHTHTDTHLCQKPEPVGYFCHPKDASCFVCTQTADFQSEKSNYHACL